MSIKHFETLLKYITPLIEKKNTLMRDALPVGLKSQITLKYFINFKINTLQFNFFYFYQNQSRYYNIGILETNIIILHRKLLSNYIFKQYIYIYRYIITIQIN